MKTVILCGGFGTRIRDVSSDVPKPMIPVGNRPILWHVMRHYAHFGHREFVLCLGHQGDVIKDFFLNYRARTSTLTVDFARDGATTYHASEPDIDWSVTLVDTGHGTMTGGRVRRIEPWVRGERFMLTYGDGLSDVDLGALVAFHERQGTVATVTGVRPPGRFGELVSSSDGRATEFNEKPQATGGLISGGFFVLEPSFFGHLEARDDLVLEEQPMRSLVAAKQLSVFQHDGFWQCMDTHRDWTLLNQMAERGNQPWKVW